MNPDIHTALLDINNLKLMETILKVLREQFKYDDQMKTAGEIVGLIPETTLECEPIVERTRRILRMSTMDILFEDLVLTACPDSCKRLVA